MAQSKALWIAGPSGSGKSTVGQVLGANDMDVWGYHTDPATQASDWIICVPIVKERILWANTARHNFSPFFVGASNNQDELVPLNWKRIVVIIPSVGALTRRLLERIPKEPGRDPVRERDKARKAEEDWRNWHQTAKRWGALLIEGDYSPKTLASMIRNV
jgi:hypothetical protein